MQDSRRLRGARLRRATVVAFVALGVAGCSDSTGRSVQGGSSGSSIATATGQVPSNQPSATATATAGTQSASIPFTCTDQQLTTLLAGLIDGLDLDTSASSGGGTDRLSCLWGTSTTDHLVNVRIDPPPASPPGGNFQSVDVPALTSIGATAQAGVTEFGGGAQPIYISTFIVTTSDGLEITVSYTGEIRHDQQIGDAAVAIAERLHG